jgi:hypothetical protein
MFITSEIPNNIFFKLASDKKQKTRVPGHETLLAHMRMIISLKVPIIHVGHG